jgi:4-amino-4-deoxy-L-arabinose transferase-like glycosyltransferase
MTTHAVKLPVAAQRRGRSGLLCAAAAAAAMLVSLGVASGPATAAALMVLLTEGALAAGIFVAAGGYGYVVVRRLVSAAAGRAMLAVTSVAAGLWMLSTAVLVGGNWLHVPLTGPWWWPVTGVGWVLAAYAIWRERLGGGVGQHADDPAAPAWPALRLLAAVAVGAGLGLMAAGAVFPPGSMGLAAGDFYDVVSYHLQVPREFLAQGRIMPLPHNTYSNYPLGGEMLFLLAMVLRGGVGQGAVAAQLTHMMWGLLAAAAVWAMVRSLLGTTARSAALAAVAVLLTAPMVVYLGWLAFVELAELAYLAVGLAWVAWWLRHGGWRPAVLAGMACGGACAIKYLSVGLIAGPLLAVMLAAVVLPAVRRQWPLARARLLGACGAGLVCLVLFSPWLVRNLQNTGNPVFPLATGLLGTGPWEGDAAQRWDRGHASKPWAQKPLALWHAVHHPSPPGARGIGIVTAAAVLASAGWLVARRRGAGPLEWACLAVAAMQVVVWATATHMAERFLVPLLVPAAVLVACALARLLSTPGRLRRMAATAAVAVLCASQLVSAWRVFQAEPQANKFGPDGSRISLAGVSLQDVWDYGSEPAVADALAGRRRLLLVCDVRPLRFDPQPVYATIWDKDPLVRLSEQTRDPAAIIAGLRAQGIDTLWFNWDEIDRVSRTYGWWRSVDRELVRSLLSAGATEAIARSRQPGLPPSLQILHLPPPVARTALGG